MSNVPREEPSEALRELVAAGAAHELSEYLSTLPPADIARAITFMEPEEHAAMLTLLSPEDAAGLLEELSYSQGADVIEELPPERAAAIIDEMETDHRVDVLGEMDEEDVEAILRAMDPEEALDARTLLTYPEDSAGGIMTTDFLVYPQDQQITEVISDMREHAEEYSDYGVQYAYTVDKKEKLVGVVRLRDLLLAPNHKPLSAIMIRNPLFVRIDTSLNELEQFFDKFTFMSLPVTDEKGELVGVVRRAQAEEAFGERAERTFMRFSGIIAGDEVRTMPLASRLFGRLAWLIVNMALNVIAASVILRYEDIVDAVFALAVVLPVICNMSGCSANQAVAVSIRELTLGMLRPRDVFRVAVKELQVGILNGIALGLLLGVVVMTMWGEGNIYLGLVVGVALATNTLVAVFLGGAIPLMLTKLRIDPATAAAPIVTTIIDACGFFLVLSIADAARAYLT